MEKKILITGCSGFLAYYLANRLKEEGYQNLSGITEEPEFNSSILKVYNVDVRDRENIFKFVKTIKPDYTFHLAAVSNVGFSWINQKMTYDINFIGSLNLIEAIREHSPGSRLLLMSSAEIYDTSKGHILNENCPIIAKNPYALSKLAMEMLADLFIASGNLDFIKIRSFNFTGPGQNQRFVASDFSHQIAEIEKSKREPVIHVGNLSAKRDISDVRDIARYLTVLMNKGEPGGIYNLCSGNTYSIEEILEILLSYSCKTIEVVVDKNKFRPIDNPVLAGDNSLIKSQFNLFPHHKIHDTLLDLLNYCRDLI
jgi:GDP-4-dehydro-6-deoxy-D-mannose reductase